ncbi:MAG TPA: hypothetical protein VK638_43300 [Edaphobacter sp.]|jgi:hypothetical protein|nr:hypothetical protein [Edaphobacter sp.]
MTTSYPLFANSFANSRPIPPDILFAISWFIRRDRAEVPGMGALVLSFAAILPALVAGWLGGELVEIAWATGSTMSLT